jgi:hypothetical protein
VLIATTAAIARTIAKMNLSIGCGAICSLPDAPIPQMLLLQQYRRDRCDAHHIPSL